METQPNKKVLVFRIRLNSFFAGVNYFLAFHFYSLFSFIVGSVCLYIAIDAICKMHNQGFYDDAE